MAYLAITHGEHAGRHFHLASRTLVAGRDPARDIQLVDPKVSRRHFQVRQAGQGHVIFEMKSVNGVFVNGQRIEGEHKLCDGDEILVGDTALVYCLLDAIDDTDAVQKPRQADRSLRDNQTLLD